MMYMVTYSNKNMANSKTLILKKKKKLRTQVSCLSLSFYYCYEIPQSEKLQEEKVYLAYTSTVLFIIDRTRDRN